MSFSDSPFSKTGKPIFPARSAGNPAHFTIEFRVPSGSAWMASTPRLMARMKAWTIALFFWIHFSDANQLAIKNLGITSPQGFESTRVWPFCTAAVAKGSWILMASIFPAPSAASIWGKGTSTNFTLPEFAPFLSIHAMAMR